MRLVLLLTAAKWIAALILAGCLYLGPTVLAATLTGGWG